MILRLVTSDRIVSTLHYPRRSTWSGRVDTLDRSSMSRARLIRRLVAESRACGAVVLDGHATEDLLAAIAIARRRRPPWVIVTESTWALGDRWLDRTATRLALRALNGPHVRYCVGSTAERDRFPHTWGVRPEQVVFLPWTHYLSDAELALPDRDGAGIFSGGDSFRDYDVLLEACRTLAVPVSIAARRLSEEQRAALPPNVTAQTVSHERFMELMHAARVVAVPLIPREDRSAGQATYLNAMAMGKVAVVTEVLGVRDYVDHAQTGLIVPPHDPAAMRSALEWALDPANDDEVARMRSAAKTVARERFGPENYLAGILEVADALLAQGPSRG